MRRRKMNREEKVNIAINMSDACIKVCVDSAKDRNSKIGEDELLERVRERISFGKNRKREV